MEKILNVRQRKAVPDLLLYRLKQAGSTVANLKGDITAGDRPQQQYGTLQVWHKKSDLDDWIAGQLRLPSSLWGPKRLSNDLMKITHSELAKLRKKGAIADWSSTKRTALFRLVNPDIAVMRPTMTGSETAPDAPAQTEQDMKTTFLSIISKSRKDNTYKFALGKTLLDYCKGNPPTGQTQVITYDYLAGEFLKHYWYQRYKFRLKQDFHTKKTPRIITILEQTFGENPPHKFEDLDQNDLRKAREGILDSVFGLARQKKGMVIQRFQRTMEGNTIRDNTTFYDYDDEKREITLKPKAHYFFRQNYGLLTRALLAEWIKYLERVNHGLPMLAAKIDNEEAERGSLKQYRNAFFEYSKDCFYCNGRLERDCIHVDHFIPWSYLFDNDAWNLVLACPSCNLQKSDSLPPKTFVDELIKRDSQYEKTMEMMRKSLLRLSFKGPWEKEIHSHYAICKEYGFGRWQV